MAWKAQIEGWHYSTGQGWWVDIRFYDELLPVVTVHRMDLSIDPAGTTVSDLEGLIASAGSAAKNSSDRQAMIALYNAHTVWDGE